MVMTSKLTHGVPLPWTLRKFSVALAREISTIIVANVVKLFDTFDRYISDCALGKRGLPDWFRGGSLRFSQGSLAPIQTWHWIGCCLEWRWWHYPMMPTQHGLHGFALYALWCRHLESLKGITLCFTRMTCKVQIL